MTGAHAWDASKAALPAWSLPKDAVDRIALPSEWPDRVTRDWALGSATGDGVRVCILDSGVDSTHPLVGELESAVVISIGEDDEVVADEDTEGDVSGHGTACAGIVRRHAPESKISSEHSQPRATSPIAGSSTSFAIVSPRASA